MTDPGYCKRCGEQLTQLEDMTLGICERCDRALPPSLVKAMYDQFDYALKLRTGEMIRFNYAQLRGEFVTLYNMKGGGPHDAAVYEGQEADDFSEDLGFLCPRGVDVRVSEIVWCADAPAGS